MAGKRKRMASDGAPGSSPPTPPRSGAGNDYEHSSLSDYSEDSRSDRSYLSDSEDEHYRSYPVAGHVVGGDSNEESEIADLLDFLQLPPLSNVPAEAEVQPPPPAYHPAAAEGADESVTVAGAVLEMMLPPAESALCLGCGREPTSVRLEPVEHTCLCLPCRSNPSGRSRCLFCDAPRR